MSFTLLARLAVAHWRELAIAALALGLVGYCHARDNALEARGRAEERARVADSTIAAVTPAMARVDTLVIRDTVRIRTTIARLDTLRVDVLKHLTDTVIVKEFVRVADSVATACNALATDCATFRALASTKISALEAKLAIAPITISRSCTRPSVLWGAVGAGAGYLAGSWRIR